MNGGDGASRWDVHIGYLPPHRWDKLPDNERARLGAGGQRERPGLTIEPVAWENLSMTPRWLGDDSSGAVAAIQPSNFFNRGAAEWGRFIAGVQARGELALAISMIGSLEEPEIVLPGGPSASVSLPGAVPGIAHVGGPRITLARAPSVAEGLGRADRDLALRLVNARDPALPWWSLDLTGAEVYPGGGGASEMINPTGTLSPLLISTASEVVAAIWTSSDESIRHYIVPWLPVWTPVLEWLGQRAIPEFVPSAARRIHSRIGEEPELQTTAEVSARAALAQLDEEYRVRRDDLLRSLTEASATADDLRHDLLFGSGVVLEDAVTRVLRDTDCDVTRLDSLLDRTASADLLVAHRGRRRLVEVKSVSGNASEQLVDTARKHLDTWPELRPDIKVEGITLVVNHQTKTHPVDRSTAVYSRPEFVRSLTVPVTTTLQLYHAWRLGQLVAIRDVVFRDTTQSHSASAAGRSSDPAPRKVRRRLWRRQHQR
jgi:hypothetical protein